MSGEIAEMARMVGGAERLLIAAGAGMGVDSGLPDFRGDEGFWKAYPPFRKLGLSFIDLANPSWFRRDPELAWGFYGHRLQLYRRTIPHAGYDILRKIGQLKKACFVFTSNVDGAFQRAGFDGDQIYECHGAIDYLQCSRGCGAGVFSAVDADPQVDEVTFRAIPPLPACPSCGAVARPNVLMFGDFGFDGRRSEPQEQRFSAFCDEAVVRSERLVVIECGAGTAVPSVRNASEHLVRRLGARLVRINVREPQVPKGELGIARGAKDALQELATLLT